MTASMLRFVLLLSAVSAVAACTRTDDGYRIETEEAVASAERAADDAAATLDVAGAKVERGIERLEREAQPVLEDAAITAKVKAKLAADPEVSGLAVDVDTTKGVVVLRGKVTSAAVSAEAEKLARNTAGVRAVMNRLVVEADARSPEGDGSGGGA